MEETDFLSISGSGEGQLFVTLPDCTNTIIQGLDLNIIAERCPLLALSFEIGSTGIPKANIEAVSRALVVSFLRYVYLGDYMVENAFSECSLLLHAQICKMAENYDVPQLQVAAHANIILQVETSCSVPHPPLDLCPAIRFIFSELKQQRPLLDTILNYCVCSFQYHALGRNEEFRNLAFERRDFHRELCRTNFNRDFEDEGAIDIVRLPVCEPNEHSALASDRAALGDFLYDLWFDFASTDSKSESHGSPSKRRKTTEGESVPLAFRPKHQADSDGDLSTDNDDSGFTLVNLPRNRFRRYVRVEQSESEGVTESDSADDHEVPSTVPKARNLESSSATIVPIPSLIESMRRDLGTDSDEPRADSDTEPSVVAGCFTGAHRESSTLDKNVKKRRVVDTDLEDVNDSDSDWFLV